MDHNSVRTKFESTTLSLSFDDNKMKRYINYVIHVRHICYLKITFCFTETLMDISKRTSSLASEDEISTSKSEDVISDTRIRRSTCAYAEALMNRSALNKLNSDQDNSSSAPKERQNEPKPEHAQVATVLCI